MLLVRGRRDILRFMKMRFSVIAFVPSMGSTRVGRHEFVTDPSLLMVEFG